MAFFLIGAIMAFGGLQAQEIRKIKMEDLAALIGSSDHPLLISFWATWCQPCLHEIPWLQTAVEKYKDKGPELWLISLDFTASYPSAIREVIRKGDYSARYFWLDETNPDRFCPVIDCHWRGGIPASLLYNPKTGYRKFINRQLTDRQALLEVEKLVAERPEGVKSEE